MSEWLTDLKQLNIGKIETDASLKKFTTYKVGGKARCVIYPKNTEKLVKLMKFIRSRNIKYKMLGNGSNLIFSDDLFDGILIKLTEFDNIEIINNKIKVGAGYSLIKLSRIALKNSLTGLEFAAGIPGTVGGAIFMNAGAYKSDISSIVEKVLVFRKGHFDWLSKEEMEFSYRHSILQDHPHWMAIACVLKLEEKNSEEIFALMNERLKRRKNSQPLERLSAGSVFRNPEGSFAWKYIDELGYRGYRQGDIEVSDKHPNFIVNCGEGKAEDFLDIVYKIQEEVLSAYGVKLVMEVEKFNC